MFSFHFPKTHFHTIFLLRPQHRSCLYHQTYQRKFGTWFLFPTSMQYNSPTSLVLLVIQSSKSSNTGADITQEFIMLLHSLRFIHSLHHDSLRHTESLTFSHNEQTCSCPTNFQLKHNKPTLEFRTSTRHDTLLYHTHATCWYHQVLCNILIHFIMRKRITKILTLSPDMYVRIPMKPTPYYLVASRARSK